MSMGPVAASGGYWIATASDKILAGPQTITGSIGVFGILPNIKELGSNYGLNWDRITTNPSSDIFSIARPKTDSELEVIQEYVNQTYERFLDLVGESRNLEVSEVEKLAEGRVWTGREAVEIGLVDKLGGLVPAVKEASKLAGLKDDYEIEEFPKIRTPADAIAELLEVREKGVSVSGDSVISNPVLKKLSNSSHLLKSMNDPVGIYGLLPWYQAQLGFKSLKINL